MALLEVRDLRVAIPLPGGVLHPVRGVDFTLERGETLGMGADFGFLTLRVGFALRLDLLHVGLGAGFHQLHLAHAFGGEHLVHDLLQVAGKDKILHVVQDDSY